MTFLNQIDLPECVFHITLVVVGQLLVEAIKLFFFASVRKHVIEHSSVSNSYNINATKVHFFQIKDLLIDLVTQDQKFTIPVKV